MADQSNNAGMAQSVGLSVSEKRSFTGRTSACTRPYLKVRLSTDAPVLHFQRRNQREKSIHSSHFPDPADCRFRYIGVAEESGAVHVPSTGGHLDCTSRIGAWRSIYNLAAVSKGMANLTVAFPYGQVLSKDQLGLRTRQICTISSLIVHGSAQSQLRFHSDGDLRRRQLSNPAHLTEVV